MKKTEKKLRIAVGADHAGCSLKPTIVRLLKKQGHKVLDFGTNSKESTDYPIYAFKVAKAVSSGRCDRGILTCGTGIGMSIAANKVKGIRAASCWNINAAKLGAEHNWLNVLCIAARFTPVQRAKGIILAWLKTPYDRGGRHERRVKRILKFESK